MRNIIIASLTVATLALPGTAQAAIPGLHLESKGSGPANSNPTNRAEVECPPGQGLLGLGGKSEGGDGQVLLDQLAATDPDKAEVRGHEDADGTNDKWAVRAYAICADQGAEVRTTTVEPFDSLSPKRRSSRENGGPCTTPRRLTGMGAEISRGANGAVMVNRLVPDNDLLGTTVFGSEFRAGTANSWSLRHYALCADGLQIQRVFRDSARTSENKHATAVCAPPSRVVGAGGEIIGATSEVAIQYMIPDEALTRVHVRGVESQDTTDLTWTVRAWALCAS